MIYRGPSFVAVVWFGSSPFSPVSKLDWRQTARQRKRDNLLTGHWGREWTRSQIIRRRESPILYKTFNTLWLLSSLAWLTRPASRLRPLQGSSRKRQQTSSHARQTWPLFSHSGVCYPQHSLILLYILTQLLATFLAPIFHRLLGTDSHLGRKLVKIWAKCS